MHRADRPSQTRSQLQHLSSGVVTHYPVRIDNSDARQELSDRLDAYADRHEIGLAESKRRLLDDALTRDERESA